MARTQSNVAPSPPGITSTPGFRCGGNLRSLRKSRSWVIRIRSSRDAAAKTSVSSRRARPWSFAVHTFHPNLDRVFPSSTSTLLSSRNRDRLRNVRLNVLVVSSSGKAMGFQGIQLHFFRSIAVAAIVTPIAVLTIFLANSGRTQAAWFLHSGTDQRRRAGRIIPNRGQPEQAVLGPLDAGGWIRGEPIRTATARSPLIARSHPLLLLNRCWRPRCRESAHTSAQRAAFSRFRRRRHQWPRKISQLP
jgi:hypothetical protein